MVLPGVETACAKAWAPGRSESLSSTSKSIELLPATAPTRGVSAAAGEAELRSVTVDAGPDAAPAGALATSAAMIVATVDTHAATR